jgi:hypothetical protein
LIRSKIFSYLSFVEYESLAVLTNDDDDGVISCEHLVVGWSRASQIRVEIMEEASQRLRDSKWVRLFGPQNHRRQASLIEFIWSRILNQNLP